MPVLWFIDVQNSAQWKAASERAQTSALKAATKAMATKWQRDFMPLHFQTGNSARYGFQPRKPTYLKRKARAGDREKNKGRNKDRSNASFTKVAAGGLIDLVYRGTLRKAILQDTTIRGFPSRATVYLHGPEYFTTRPRNPARPNLGREILKIINSERAELRAEATLAFNKELNRPRKAGRPKRIS